MTYSLPRIAMTLAGLSALALVSTVTLQSAHAQLIVTTGAGTAVTGTPNRVATFDRVSTNTDLTNYSEGLLSITIPSGAYTDYDPSYGNGGFSGGFFYPRGGAGAYTVLRGTDNALLSAVEFNVGDGYGSNSQTYFYYRALSGGTVIGSGSLAVPRGTVIGISNTAGFDTLDIGAAYSLAGAQQATSTTQNVLAIDNVHVNLGGSAAAAPEPGTVALLALSGLPAIGAIARRRRRSA